MAGTISLAGAAPPLHEIGVVAGRSRLARTRDVLQHRLLPSSEPMMGVAIWAGAWLVQSGAASPDTIYAKMIPAVPSTFARIAGVASSLLTIAILVFVVAAVPALWNFRKSYRRINRLLERIYGDINPIMRHASAVADNVDYVTTAIRTDVQQINATILSANQRLQKAVALTEQRLTDISALLQVVQEEAERMFVTTASTVRGVRQGASALRENGSGPKFATDGDDDDFDDFDDSDDFDDPVTDADSEREEEATYGYERTASSAPDGPARPRIRPRAGRRGPTGPRDSG